MGYQVSVGITVLQAANYNGKVGYGVAKDTTADRAVLAADAIAMPLGVILENPTTLVLDPILVQFSGIAKGRAKSAITAGQLITVDSAGSGKFIPYASAGAGINWIWGVSTTAAANEDEIFEMLLLMSGLREAA